jgi:hypothetical protein
MIHGDLAVIQVRSRFRGNVEIKRSNQVSCGTLLNVFEFLKLPDQSMTVPSMSVIGSVNSAGSTLRLRLVAMLPGWRLKAVSQLLL